jgi:DNA-binding SARP family transcriptional activator
MEFRVLGSLEVVADDRSLRLGGAKQRALLAILLIHANRVVSTDRLMDDLWGDEPPQTAGNILQVYVSQLRKILRAGSDGAVTTQELVTRPPGYAMQIQADDLDLATFERLLSEGRQALAEGEPATASALLRSGLALFRGSPLADFSLEPFAQAEIERVEELRVAALEERLRADLALGRDAELVGEIEALAREHPLRERLRELLMLALYRAGRQAEALEVYQETMRVLADDLGIDPGPDLQRLHERILQHDPALDAQPIAPTQRTVAPEIRSTSDVSADAISDIEDEAEGDQFLLVTALFADIVNSTALGDRLTAEEVRAVIGECVGRISRVVEAFGGTVQAYMGDGICAYFGVPRGHEDDPERAALAALRILDVVRSYAQEIETAWGLEGFNVRIGVNTGRTVVGMIGAGSPQRVAFGDSTNVAARLQAAADPGSIFIGERFADAVGSMFGVEPLPPLRVKGKREPIHAWRLVARREVMDLPAPTPLLGRDEEVGLGRQIIEQLLVGRGGIALVHGEAGVGKTRFLTELREIAGDRVRWLAGGCRSYEGDPPHRPFVEILRTWLEVTESDPELTLRTKLQARLASLFDEDAAIELRPRLGHLISVPDDRGSSAPQSDPGTDEASLRVAFVRWVEALARIGPLVLSVDDLHAADPGTLDLLRDLFALTDRAGVLVIVATRPEPASAGWRLTLDVQTDYGHRMTALAIDPLSRESAGELAEALAPIGSLDDRTREEVIERSEGNPLFLEELMRTLVESGGLQRDAGGSLSFSRAALILPPALESLLVARLQRLPGTARTVAQVAATIGQEFPVDVVEAVIGTEIDDALTSLLRAEVIQEHRRHPSFECAFRHGLMREAALSTITPARSKELFGQVGTALEERHASDIDEQLERLAYLFYRSDQQPKAIEYLTRAGQRAAVLDAPTRAIELFDRARQLAVRIGDRAAEERVNTLVAEHAAARIGQGGAH